MTYDFKTWKEVQDKEVDYWQNHLFSELKDVANVWDHIKNWEDVGELVDANTCDVDVAEDFLYDNDKWIDEILVQIKPYFEEWLDYLLKDTDIDYSDYVANFWTNSSV